ncbi:MAG: DUF177 domain-containing protein [Pseudomonadota bacterium]
MPEKPNPAALFRRELPAARLTGDAVEVSERATPEERAALRAALELAALERLELFGRLTAEGAERWRFEGRLVAALDQICVATLAPAPAEIDAPVTRIWAPAAKAPEPPAPGAEIEIDGAADEVEPLPDPLDFGAVAVEELLLALDPFPRAPGAPAVDLTAAPPGAPPLEDARPFEALAALKDRLTPAAGEAAESDGGDARPDQEETPRKR